MSPALDSVPQGVLVALVGLIFLALLLLILDISPVDEERLP